MEPRGYERDDFEVSLWTYYEPATTAISPASYDEALERLHAGMRKLDIPTPHFTDRVASAEQLFHGEPHPGNVLSKDKESMRLEVWREFQKLVRDHG